MGTQTIIGSNDLSTLYPNIADEWHPHKNGERIPSMFLPQSNIKVWWLGKCGHEWEAVISSRTRNHKSGCPYCANKRVLKGFNDLATTNPKLIKEWDYEKNDISPEEVTRGTSRKAWWICSRGHSYESPISGRTGKRERGCPYCTNQKLLRGFNDLETVNPKLALEWNADKNNGTRANEILAGGHKKVWWKCQKGHEWECSIIARISMNIGCPFCSSRYAIQGRNDLQTTNPSLIDEWAYEKNGELQPSNVKAGSHKSVWWKCKNCGNYWKAIISDRVRGNGCPFCTKSSRTSAPEQIIFYYMSIVFPNTVNGYKPKWLEKGSEIDIYIPDLKIGIEYDGERWHKNIDKDIAKNRLCQKNGVRLLRLREMGCPKFPSEFDSITVTDFGQNLSSLEPVILQIIDYIGVDRIDVNIERDLPKILSAYENNKQERSLSSQYPEVAKEWNFEKNEGLTPNMVTANSNRKLWWLCSKCGYEWSASVNNRVKRGCPACSNKIVWKGHNDLATINPDFLDEWAYDLNLEISPSDITPGAEKKVWWRCKKCGYTWQTQPYRRKRGSGCPVCSGKAVWQGHNDMATIFPNVAEEWDYEKNGDLVPSQVTAGSTRRVWWKCKKCGNVWQTGIDNRTHKRSGCPICARKRQ